MNLYYFYALPFLISAIFSLALGFFVYYKKNSKKKYLYFLLTCFSVFIWLFFRFLASLTNSIFLIDFFLRLSYVGIIFFPINFFHFFYIFWGKKNKFDKYLIFFSYIMGFFFVLGLFGTSLFLNETHKYYWGLSLSANVFHFPFVIFLTFLIFRMVYFLSVNIRNKNEFSTRSRYQMKYISWSLLFLVLTSSDFFINYGLEYYPLGSLFILVSLSIFAYIILIKHPKDNKLVLKKSSVFFVSLISLVILISILKYFSLIFHYKDSIWVNYIFLILAMFIYPYLRDYYYNLANKYFFTSSYSGRKLLAELSENLNSVLILRKMYKYIGDAITKSMHPKFLYILIFDKNKKKYIIKYKKGASSIHKNQFHYDKSSDKYLSQKCRVLNFNDFRSRFEFKSKNLIDMFIDLKSEIFIPLSIKDKMIGIIVLGVKKSGDIYNENDYEILSLMAKQIAVSLENALNYKEIKDFNLKLEKEIGLATKELRDANKKLRLLDQTKSEFISIASHQLRTPLTVVKGYISMLIDNNFGKLKNSQKDALVKVYDSNERLINLVENLLNISRIESGKLTFNIESNSIEKIVMSVMEELRAYAEGKGLFFTYQGPEEKLPLINIDSEKLRQSIMNLIDNAIKYTSKGYIRVKLFRKLDKIIFCVEDSGLGIEKKELDILFKKFSRGTNTHLIDANGTGLGLFVAHKMIEAHQGKIWAESDGTDKGSKFCFELPI